MTELKEEYVDSSSLSASNGGSLHPAPIPSEISIDSILEKKITAKFDKFMMPPMALIMIIAYLDRSNIGLSRFRLLHLK
jgi:hypothetical protein